MSAAEPLRRLRVAPEVIAKLLDAYTRAAEAERVEDPCGFVVGSAEPTRVTLYEVHPAVNRHAHPERAFAVDADEQRQVQKDAAETGLSVLGFWSARLLGPPKPVPADSEAMKTLVASEAPPLALIVGQGAGRRPVIRAYAWEPDGPREVAVVV